MLFSLTSTRCCSITSRPSPTRASVDARVVLEVGQMLKFFGTTGRRHSAISLQRVSADDDDRRSGAGSMTNLRRERQLEGIAATKARRLPTGSAAPVRATTKDWLGPPPPAGRFHTWRTRSIQER